MSNEGLLHFMYYNIYINRSNVNRNNTVNIE